MKNNGKLVARYFIFFVFTLSFVIVPFVFLIVGLKKSGIILNFSFNSGLGLENFNNLLFGTDELNVNFRLSMIRSLYYSVLVSAGCVIISLFYTIWIQNYKRSRAIEFSFLLLNFTLLPQTYFIIPILILVKWLNNSLPEQLIITLALFITLLPLAAWGFYLITGKKIRKLLESVAVDGLHFNMAFKFFFRELQNEFLLVFFIVYSFCWGNYLIPFSLGSHSSFTAIVQITNFTSNLGRNWAMISAAGFLLCLPIIIISLFFIIKVGKGKGIKYV
jgi:ABC-type glycerol-3-phosphate transport system permease component